MASAPAQEQLRFHAAEAPVQQRRLASLQHGGGAAPAAGSTFRPRPSSFAQTFASSNSFRRASEFKRCTRPKTPLLVLRSYTEIYIGASRVSFLTESRLPFVRDVSIITPKHTKHQTPTPEQARVRRVSSPRHGHPRPRSSSSDLAACTSRGCFQTAWGRSRPMS